jgi:hypothetical protein
MTEYRDLIAQHEAMKSEIVCIRVADLKALLNHYEATKPRVKVKAAKCS